MATVEISLSRAHKVAERFKVLAKEAQGEAISLASSQTIRGVAGEAQIQRMAEQGRKALVMLERAEILAKALVAVRMRIGQENEVRGIGAMLAELDGLNKRIALKKELLSYAKNDTLGVEELQAHQQANPTDHPYGVSVRVLPVTFQAEAEQAISQLQRETFALSDRIAEANAKRMTLELADELLAEVTGSA